MRSGSAGPGRTVPEANSRACRHVTGTTWRSKKKRVRGVCPQTSRLTPFCPGSGWLAFGLPPFLLDPKGTTPGSSKRPARATRPYSRVVPKEGSDEKFRSGFGSLPFPGQGGSKVQTNPVPSGNQNQPLEATGCLRQPTKHRRSLPPSRLAVGFAACKGANSSRRK